MPTRSLAAISSLLAILLPSCVTTLSPPRPAAAPAPPRTAQQVQYKAPTTKGLNIGTGSIKPVYLLGRPPAGKSQPTSVTPTQMKKTMAALAPSKASKADKAVFARYSAGKSQRANNWMRGFDFSGVAWDTPRTATLISDRHVLMAAHYDRKRGAKITFHDRNGQAVTRTLVAVKRGPMRGKFPYPDVSVGRLDQPVPSSVTWYPTLPAGDYKTRLMHQDMLVTNMRRTVDRYYIVNIYHSKATDMVRSGNITSLGLDKSWSGELVAGDSGNPVFVVVNGQLVLVGTSTFGGLGSNGPLFAGPHIQRFIKQSIEDLERQFR